MRVEETMGRVVSVEPRLAFEGTTYAKDLGDKTVTIESVKGAQCVLFLKAALHSKDVDGLKLGDRVKVTLETE